MYEHDPHYWQAPGSTSSHEPQRPTLDIVGSRLNAMCSKECLPTSNNPIHQLSALKRGAGVQLDFYAFLSDTKLPLPEAPDAEATA